MSKMHLTATPRNEGARRLAHWIGTECGGDLSVAERLLFVDECQLGRLLDGSLLPGSILLTDLVPRTEGAVMPLDWYNEAVGDWYDMPADRQALAA